MSWSGGEPTHEDEAAINAAQWEADESLMELGSIRRRLEVLDRLDALGPEVARQGLVERLERVNAELHERMREEIRRGACPAMFAAAMAGEPPRGLGYNWLDDVVSGVLGLDEPAGEERRVAERVFYQPTPARHVFALARLVTACDLFVDLGSGLGHVPLLVSACTGARCVGVEVERRLVECARRCAEGLNLDRVRFWEGDALEANLSEGTVFYLYTPFTGGILRGVLDRLREEARVRALRVATFGPCTQAVGREDWLEASAEWVEDRVVMFESRKPSP